MKGMRRWASVTLLEWKSLSSELLVWLGHLLGHLDREAAWLFLGSGLESGSCCIPTKGMLGLSGTGFVKLGSHSSFCTLCIHSDILSRWEGEDT